MRRKLALGLAALTALLLGSTDAHKDFPGNTGGGNAGMFDFCRNGGKGIGYIPDSYGGTYGATCGNYNWSAESGGLTGTSADAAGYQKPTTAGGNSIYLTCTGAGAGTGSNGITYDVSSELQFGAPTDLTAGAGSGVNTWVDSGSNFPTSPTNAMRGLMIAITTAGGGPTVGTRRYIISNTATTLTLDGANWSANPVNGATKAIIYDPIGSTCRAAGEIVKTNSMADIMLAQDHTRLGGTVYFPQLARTTIPLGEGTETGLLRATIYADEQCGRKGLGSATTPNLGSSFNACPVMRAPSDEHFQRVIQQVGERTWEFEGSDTDGDQNGRTGVWLVTDNGSRFQTDTTQTGRDDADGRIDTGWAAPTVGVKGGLNRMCAMTAGKCVPANNTAEGSLQIHGIVSNAVGRIFTLGNSPGAQLTTNFCFDATSPPTNVGMCRDDARVQCSAGSDCTTAGLTNATCDSPWSYLDFLVNTQKQQPIIMVQFTPEGYPENGGASDVQEVGYARINAVTNTTTNCAANNKNAAFQSYPVVGSRIRTAIGATGIIIDEGVWEHNAAPMRGGTWSPNNYFGLDLNKNATSDPGDCLSGGTATASDDEPECESGEGLSLMSGMQGKIERMTMANCSSVEAGSCFDGDVISLHNQVDNLTMVQTRRGAWADLSDITMKDMIVRDSPVTAAGVASGINIGFVSGPRVDGLYFYNAAATSLVFLNQGHNMHLNHIRFEGTNGVGFLIDYADGLEISDVQFLSHTGLLANIFTELAGAEQFGPIAFTNWTATGNNNIYNGGNILGAISLSRGGGADGTGIGATSAGVLMDNIHVNSNSTNLCLFNFDDDGTAGDGGPINVYRSKWRLTNSEINNLNGTTGAKPICVKAHTAFFDSSSETGIFNEKFQPSWVNLRANGVPIADQPYPQTQADNVNNGGFDCDVVDRGTVVHITNDITAAGTCGDTDANHALEGGGTFRSICKCGAAGAWAPF